MNHDPVIVEETFNAPVWRVWAAITEKEKMKLWYFDLKEFKPVVGFEFSFVGKGVKGQEYVHLCKITSVVPYKKLQFTWSYQNIVGTSQVTFELFEISVETKLRLTHEGLHTFPENMPDFAHQNFLGGWTDLIQKQLPGFLDSPAAI